MRRIGWSAIAGLGLLALLQVGASARAEGPGAKSETTPSSEGAKGSGMGGTSTGARPGEVSGAAREPSAADASKSPAGPTESVSGKIEKYDRENRTLSLSNSEKKLRLSDDTEVLKDGQKISPGQLMEGDEVRASYSGSGDTVEAKRLEVTSGGGAGRSGEAPATGSKPGSTTDGGSPK